MKLHDLTPAPGAKQVEKRLAVAPAPAWARPLPAATRASGPEAAASATGFEGGQMPLTRRLPKRGFTNIFAKVYTVINISELESLETGSVVTAELLKELGIISKIEKDGLKVLGRGELTKALTVKAAKFSASAKAAIEAVGGTAEVIG